MVPYFNAPIYLDKNSKIGKVDEVTRIVNKAESVDAGSLSGCTHGCTRDAFTASFSKFIDIRYPNA